MSDLRDGIQFVVGAWQVAGPQPEYQQARRAQLWADWPVLAAALDGLAVVANESKRSKLLRPVGLANWSTEARRQRYLAP